MFINQLIQWKISTENRNHVNKLFVFIHSLVHFLYEDFQMSFFALSDNFYSFLGAFCIVLVNFVENFQRKQTALEFSWLFWYLIFFCQKPFLFNTFVKYFIAFCIFYKNLLQSLFQKSIPCIGWIFHLHNNIVIYIILCSSLIN